MSSSARSWNFLERLTAPPPRRPIAQGHLTTTGPQDADWILSFIQTMTMLEVSFQFPCEQIHAGVSTWLDMFWQRPTNQLSTGLSEFTVNQTPHPPRLVFETRAKCQDIVARFKDDGTHTIVPLAISTPQYRCFPVTRRPRN